MRTIANQLGRSPSTVSREIKRNGSYADYRAVVAEKAAWQRALRPKVCKLTGRLNFDTANQSKTTSSVVASTNIRLAKATIP